MKGIKHRETVIAGYEGIYPIVVCHTHLVNRKIFVAKPGEVDWRFYCQYCRCYHHHGAAPGHRVAHCGASSPFSKTGYILQLEVEA